MVTKPYLIPGTSVHLDVGMKVMIPVYGLHNDPKYFPEPEIFDPENFSDEGKARRPHNTYLSFGDGPRNCIGNIILLMTSLTYISSTYYYSLYKYICIRVQNEKLIIMLVLQNLLDVNFYFFISFL